MVRGSNWAVEVVNIKQPKLAVVEMCHRPMDVRREMLSASVCMESFARNRAEAIG